MKPTAEWAFVETPKKLTKQLQFMKFKIVSDFSPTGDQPQAIKHLISGIEANERYQT